MGKYIALLLVAALGSAQDYIEPLKGWWESSPPGYRTSPIGGDGPEIHQGLDMVPVLDWTVYAAAAGRVATHFPPPSRIYKGHRVYGGMIVLEHDLSLTLYGHMKKTFVREGQWVEQGQPIGIVGDTGMSAGNHLHFQIIDNPKRFFEWSARNRTRLYWLRMSFKQP